MCRIDLCGQNGVKISSYGDTIFLKFNPLNCPMGQFIPREDRQCWNAGMPECGNNAKYQAKASTRMSYRISKSLILISLII